MFTTASLRLWFYALVWLFIWLFTLLLKCGQWLIYLFYFFLCELVTVLNWPACAKEHCPMEINTEATEVSVHSFIELMEASESWADNENKEREQGYCCYSSVGVCVCGKAELEPGVVGLSCDWLHRSAPLWWQDKWVNGIRLRLHWGEKNRFVSYLEHHMKVKVQLELQKSDCMWFVLFTR